MKIRVHVEGCDDTTIVETWANNEELDFLEDLIKKVNETSSYSCMPTMSMEILNAEGNS